MSTEHDAPIAVVVGLLRDADGHILLCQRPPGKRYPLEWEFPGGKVEPGESAGEALVRELREELAVEAEIGALVHSQVAHYDDGNAYAVGYYRVDRWNGALANVVFNDVQWVDMTDLPSYPVLAGNVEICRMLAGGELLR